MKRRVYLGFISIVLPSVLLLALLLSFLIHGALRERERGAVREYTRLVAEFLDAGEGLDYQSLTPIRHRVTVIAPDGTVLFDNRVAAEGEWRADRPEVIAAFETGRGENERYSETHGAETYYFALRLADGNVLRMSQTVSELADVLYITLPLSAIVTAFVMLVANFAARKMTRRIVEPIEKIALDDGEAVTDVYEELAPFVKKIETQKQEIAEKIESLSERAGAIEAITSNMREGLILTGRDGVVLTANESARKIFGGLLRRDIRHICREEDFRNGVNKCLSGENAETSLERGGRLYSVFFSPVYSGGMVSGAVIFFLDTTMRHRAERQRREFSANVSHELKTPLTTISALSEMIVSGMAREGDIEVFAARISDQAGRLLEIINDIIRLSEFDEGGIAKEFSEFDLYDLAQNVIAAVGNNARDVTISLTGERFSVSANRRMIDELLYNLIDNGVKYNKPGGSVTVSLSRAENGLCKIEVTDTGIGIPPDHIDRVFERFYRVDNSRSKKTGGTGLGLSIVKHIAEYHGGRVEVSSVEGGDTTVTCYIVG